MINKWLDILEEKLNSDYDEEFCGVATTLFTLDYPMDVWCLDCDEDNQKLCKAKAREIIAKIREEWKWYKVELAHEIKLLLENKQAINEENTVKYINLGLSLIKDKLVKKHDVLFNKYELTEVEQGELRATTEMLYSIDDIMKKQAINNKTSDTSSETRKELDNVNHQKHQNMTIRNLVEVGYFKFAVKLDDSYYEFECLPTDFIDFVYGEDFLNQEIIAIEQGTDGKMYVTLKEE